MQAIKIVSWKDEYHQAFKDLSVEWLERYVSVEPADVEILEYPYENVLNQGGEIFFALLGEEAVGTVAMIKIGNDTYELAKLAVTERCKGQGIGELLVRMCLKFTRDKQVRKVLLYTNHKLQPAIGLYRKMGFKDVDLTANKYLESDMKMLLEMEEE